MEAIPRRNLELKFRCTDLAMLRATVRQLCGGIGELELQSDTYFHVPNGRLKLREIQDRLPLLIWYRRPDRTEVRASDYQLVAVTEPAQLKAALTGALGLRGVVKKRREIYLWHNVRIHLDDGPECRSRPIDLVDAPQVHVRDLPRAVAARRHELLELRRRRLLERECWCGLSRIRGDERRHENQRGEAGELAHAPQSTADGGATDARHGCTRTG